jgi:hypothetical protein
MKALTIAAATATIALSSLTAPTTARANDGAVAAGVAGGLLGGLLLGGAMAPRPYYEPAPVYVSPPPPYRCYWTRGEPVWDDWRGVWVRPRMRVCD